MLDRIHRSKAYNLYHKVQTVRKGIKTSPVKYSKRAAKKLLKDPAFLLRKFQRNTIESTILVDPRDQYREWIKLNEPTNKDLIDQSKISSKLKYKPIISIITPVFNPPKAVLVELIDSILNQSYPYWELCLGEFGQNNRIQHLITGYAKKDSRIKYKFFTNNGGIAENSNSCLDLASGEYIALLDHDDTLSPDALYENAKKLNEAKYDFIYSDKDKINESGERFGPLFKPDWSPHLMYSANYLTHLNVIKKSVVEKVGKWNPATDGAQDWDLFFRVTENTNKIAHIPKVLYHWRVSETSTAMSIETKPYALEGQINSLNYHLKKLGKDGSAYLTDELMLAVKWQTNVVHKNIAFILVDSLNNIPSIEDRLYFLPDNTDINFIASNTASKSDDLKGYKIHFAEESNKSSLIRKIAQKSSAEYVFIIDSSCEKFSKDFYEEMVGWAKQTEVGYVAPLGLTSKKQLIGSMVVFGLGGVTGRLFKGAGIEVNDGIFGSPHWYRDVTMLSTDILCIRRTNFVKHFKDVSTNLEDNLQLSMIRLTQDSKYNILDTRATVVINSPCPSLPPEDEKIRLFLKETKLCMYGDPYFNENLSLGYLSPHLHTSQSELEKLPINSQKMFNNYFTKGTQITASVEKLNDISFIEKYDFTNKVVNQKKVTAIKKVHWFLAGFDSVYAGLNNIFTFASYLAKNEDIENIFYIDTQSDVDKETKLIRAYSELTNCKVEKYNEGASIPECDLAIATLWTTAFYVAKHDGAKKKAYFIQDDETLFYKPGSVSALVEASYQLGLIGIANTLGLKMMYENKYSGKALLLRSSIDLSSYTNNDDTTATKKPYKVFFYGRPAHPRNGFELGVSALKKLKSSLGDDVYIMCAGADWDPGEYGLTGVVTNLGKLPMNKLPEFYKNLDAALFLMFSKHPGVVPSELMVSGCPVVVNKSSDETWNELYRSNETAVVCLPTTTSIYNGLLEALTNSELRKKIIPSASKTAKEYYSVYEEEAKGVVNKLKSL